MQDAILQATQDDHYAAFAALVREYVDWARRRDADQAWFVDAAYAHPSLDDELAALARRYAPPHGVTLLARRGAEVVACGAYRLHRPGVAEMKRVFVSPRGQRAGTGRALCVALLAAARAQGCAWMRLDTGRRMVEAIAWYRSLGFAPCAPYHDDPPEFAPHLLFMERAL